MSFWKKLFGVASSPATAAVDVATNAAGKVADIVERWAPSAAAKHEMSVELQGLITKAAADARAYDPRSESTVPFAQVVNVLVDALSRLIRPGLTVALIGGMFGWWELRVVTTDPVIVMWGEGVMIFWFGQRALFKDLPALVKTLRGVK